MPSPRAVQPHSRLLPNLTGVFIDSGRIHLLSIIGAGTYGIVYRAVAIDSDIVRPRFYAVKCQTRAPGGRLRLHQQREIGLHRRASGHPGVVSLQRVLVEHGFLFMILDWCQDGDLFTVLTERNPFVGNDTFTKAAFLQLIDSVEYIHSLGIIHRDIKPENILCSGSRLLVTDFGLATEQQVGREYECGSSYYMSPECVGEIFGRAKPFVYAPGDIWALGIMFVNMSCARNPWGNASRLDQCFRMFLHDHNFLRQKLPITRPMNDLLQRIFTIDPHVRITLAELRLAVIRLGAFTLTREQLSAANPSVRAAALAAQRHCVPPVHRKPVPMVVHVQPGNGNGDDGAAQGFGKESWRLEQAIAEALKDIARQSAMSMEALAGSQLPPFASASTAPSTPGPVTPEMLATDAAQVVANVDDDVLDINCVVRYPGNCMYEQGASLQRSNAIKKKKKASLPRAAWKKIRKLVG